MKILYLVHQFYPEWYTGTEKFVLNQAMMMQRFGHKVKVLTYSFYEDSSYDNDLGSLLYKEFIYKGIPVVAIKHKLSPIDMNHTLNNREILNISGYLIDKIRPDIVHVGHLMRLGGLMGALPGFNIPYIMTLTDFFMICPKVTLITSKGPLCTGPIESDACRNLCPEWDTGYIKSRLEVAKIILGNAHLVASPSRFLADIFNKELKGLNVQVIPHGLKYSLIKKNEKKYRSGDYITFCYAGSLNIFKGVHVLIEAFKKVHSDHAILKVYGSGSEQGYVSKLMLDSREDRRIEFCGVYSEEKTGDILGNSDVVIVPSLWYENYPLVLHEALACDVPVIASGVGGMAEKVRHGSNGFLFDMGNSEQLRELLQGIVNDPSILNSVKQGINCLTSPTIEQESYTYERIYKQLV